MKATGDDLCQASLGIMRLPVEEAHRRSGRRYVDA